MDQRKFGFVVGCVCALVVQNGKQFQEGPNFLFISQRRGKPHLKLRQPTRGRGHGNRACHSSRQASRQGLIARRRAVA